MTTSSGEREGGTNEEGRREEMKTKRRGWEKERGRVKGKEEKDENLGWIEGRRREKMRLRMQLNFHNLPPAPLPSHTHTQSHSLVRLPGASHRQGSAQAAEGQEHEDTSRLLRSSHCPGSRPPGCPRRSRGSHCPRNSLLSQVSSYM